MTSNPPPGPPQEPPPGGPGPGQQPGNYPPPQQYGQPGQYPPPAQQPPPPQEGWGQPQYQQPGQYPPPQQQQPPQQQPPQHQPPQQHPGQQPPQQQYGQYGGPPPAQYGAPAKPGFDFNSVDNLDWGIIGAGVVAFIFSFFEFYTASAKGDLKVACDRGGVSGDICSPSEGAWHGFLGWFGVLLLLVAALFTAVAVFAPHVKMPFSARLGALASAALGLLFVFIALFVTPTPDSNGQLPAGTTLDDFLDFSRGFSYWIILILAAGATALAYLRFQQTGGNLAALFSGMAKKPPAGGYGPPQNYPGPQGYQQQAPSGYQSPPPPQPGYQPQPPPGGYQPPAGYQPPPPQQPGYQPPPQQGYQQPPPQQQQPQPGYQPPPQQGYQQPPPQQAEQPPGQQ